jgi:acetyl esterase/lipase
MSPKTKLGAWLSAATVILTTACSPLGLLNVAVPNGGYHIAPGIDYGPALRNKLDVYVPRRTTTQPLPVVVFFYGGAWEAGRRDDYEFVAEALTSQGFIVVIPDYRVYPEARFPGFLHDAAAAVAWIRQNIASHGGDEEELFLMGHSAGAHIAAMLTLNGEYLREEGLEPEDLAGMIGLAGPYDFLPLQSERLKTIFGPEAERWKSQPINFITGDNAPMLLLVGTADKTVWPRNTYNLAAKIKAAGGPVQMVEYPGWGHVDIVAKLAKPLRDRHLLQSITEFIRTNADGGIETVSRDN